MVDEICINRSVQSFSKSDDVTVIGIKLLRHLMCDFNNENSNGKCFLWQIALKNDAIISITSEFLIDF